MNKGKWLLAVSLSLVAVFNSCKEDTGSIGANVLPNSDLIGTNEVDTSPLLTSMYLRDSVATNEVDNSMLGSYSDPTFGTVKASIYAHIFSPIGASTSSINWTDSIVDSAVLVLSLNSGYYGNIDPQTFVVDTLERSITASKAYYSDNTIKYGPSPIATVQMTPNPANDSLKIKLNKSWVNYIVSRIHNTADSDYYYTHFDSLVKGLYITVSNPLQLPGQGGLLYVNLGSTSAGIYFYFHSATRTLRYTDGYINFPIQNGTTGTGLYFNHIDRNYATAPFASEHPSGTKDSIDGNNLVYVQNMGGVIGRINFPGLYKNWSKLNPVLINKAELDMTVDAQYCPLSYPAPDELFVYGTDKYGSPYLLPDQNSITSSTNYGGIYNQSNYTYTFTITQYIQKVIQGTDTDRGLFIIPAYESTTANRVVLYGAQHNVAAPSNNRMKLKIFYTPLASHKAIKH